MEGNYPAVLMNHTDLHYRHKVFQVIQESRDCTRSIWIIFSVLFYFPHGRKKRKGNELWQWIIEFSIITQPYKLCNKLETKVRTVLSGKITQLAFFSLLVEVSA